MILLVIGLLSVTFPVVDSSCSCCWDLKINSRANVEILKGWFPPAIPASFIKLDISFDLLFNWLILWIVFCKPILGEILYTNVLCY